MLDPPLIMVSDWSDPEPVTLHYYKGANELNLETIWVAMADLPYHSGRGRLKHFRIPGMDGQPRDAYSLAVCKPDFLDAFWTLAANLADYFADFAAHDTAHMVAAWFQLVDDLLDVAKLPHHYWLRGVAVAPFCPHAQDFVHQVEEWRDTLVLACMPKRSAAYVSLIRADAISSARLKLDQGGFKSGLKLWQQFLYKDAPGFTVPLAERVYADDEGLDRSIFEQQIPRGGLAIMKKHTDWMRELAREMAPADELLHGDEKIPLMDDFNNNALTFDCAQTYTSVDGSRKLIKPMHPNPESADTPQRLPGLFDPELWLQRPNHALLNDCVATQKGEQVFEAQGDPDKFQMMSLATIDSSDSNGMQSKIDRKEWSEMFEDWVD